jgi:hypothetical protein
MSDAQVTLADTIEDTATSAAQRQQKEWQPSTWNNNARMLSQHCGPCCNRVGLGELDQQRRECVLVWANRVRAS